jgi:hypothetical protein
MGRAFERGMQLETGSEAATNIMQFSRHAVIINFQPSLYSFNVKAFPELLFGCGFCRREFSY